MIPPHAAVVGDLFDREHAALPPKLLAPLWLFPARAGFGFLQVAAVSVLFGLAAAGLHPLWRKLRARPR